MDKYPLSDFQSLMLALTFKLTFFYNWLYFSFCFITCEFSSRSSTFLTHLQSDIRYDNTCIDSSRSEEPLMTAISVGLPKLQLRRPRMGDPNRIIERWVPQPSDANPPYYTPIKVPTVYTVLQTFLSLMNISILAVLLGHYPNRSLVAVQVWLIYSSSSSSNSRETLD